MSGLPFAPNKPFDVIGLGRLCIDLNANETGRPLEDVVTFTRYLGGSPANIAVGAARLGLRTGFIGKVAADPFGRFIVRYLRENGIDTSGVITDAPGSVTGLTFTEMNSPEEGRIYMYRENAADLNLAPNDVSEAYVASTKALLISGTALARSPSREAVFVALDYARRHGAVVVFDLDYRPYTWTSPEETAVYYRLAAETCDVVIGTREEFDRMARFDPPSRGDDEATARRLFAHRAQLVVIKHGKAGSVAYTRDGRRVVGSVFPARVVKPFGAGDAYAAALLYGLLRGWPLERCLAYGSAAAAIVIARHSCSDAMPTAGEIDAYLRQVQSGKGIGA